MNATATRTKPRSRNKFRIRHHSEKHETENTLTTHRLITLLGKESIEKLYDRCVYGEE